MAMALLDAGVPADRFRIDAVDISAQALAHGRGAPCTERTPFAASDLAFRDRHFDATRGGASAARRRAPPGAVSSRAICSAPDFLPGAGHLRRDLLPQPADLLRPRRRRIAPSRVLERLLTPDGVAVRRPVRNRPAAELTASCSAKVPLAFAFRKGGGRARCGRRTRRTVRLGVRRRRRSGRSAGSRARLGSCQGGRPRRRCRSRSSTGQPTPSTESRRSRASSPTRGASSKPASGCEEHLRRSRPVGGGVPSAGPGPRRERRPDGRRRAATARRSISTRITTRRSSTWRCCWSKPGQDARRAAPSRTRAPAGAGEPIRRMHRHSDAAATAPPPPCRRRAGTAIGVRGDGSCPELDVRTCTAATVPVYSDGGRGAARRPRPGGISRRLDAPLRAAQGTSTSARRSPVVIFRIGAEWLALPTSAM